MDVPVIGGGGVGMEPPDVIEVENPATEWWLPYEQPAAAEREVAGAEAAPV